MSDERVEQTLDRAASAREVAIFTALVLMQAEGDGQAALLLLYGMESEPGLAPESIDELDCVTIAQQAIRTALVMRGGVPLNEPETP